MKILNLYFSSTGNTARVANRITATVERLGHQIDTVKVTGDQDLDLLAYDFIFVGSGVYQWLPGKGLQEFIQNGWPIMPPPVRSNTPRPGGPIKRSWFTAPTAGRIPESTKPSPRVKFMGQLFDHLGFEIVAEWYYIGEYPAEGRFKISPPGSSWRHRRPAHDADLPTCRTGHGSAAGLEVRGGLYQLCLSGRA